MTSDLELAISAAQAAGVVIMRAFGTDMKVTHKSPDQPLTHADLAADELLKQMLSGARPHYGWLSEETADDPARLDCERVWIVDPIDGTRSFISARPEFAVSIGLAERGIAIVGVVLNPATGECFHAERGRGASVLMNGATRAIHVRERGRTLVASRSELMRGDFDELEGWEIEPLGSTAYKLAAVASGMADAFFSRGPKSEWDVCAGALIVEEAGGIATDLNGERYTYNRRDPAVFGTIAARAPLHGEVVKRVRGLAPVNREGNTNDE